LEGKNSKFLADAGFLCDNSPVTAAVFRDMINLLPSVPETSHFYDLEDVCIDDTDLFLC
jgi:hypothetical protein